MGTRTYGVGMRAAGAAVGAALLSAGCADATSEREAVDATVVAATETVTELETVAPQDAEAMTIAEVLRTDERFSRFRELAERAQTPVDDSWLAVWDWNAERMGDDREGVTVFVPTDDAFDALDPAVVAVLEDPGVNNGWLYDLLGHHYVHRLYPSDEFEAGPQRTWRQSASGPVQLAVDPVTWGGQPAEQTDLRVANGVLHVSGGVVVPDAVTAAADD